MAWLHSKAAAAESYYLNSDMHGGLLHTCTETAESYFHLGGRATRGEVGDHGGKGGKQDKPVQYVPYALDCCIWVHEKPVCQDLWVVKYSTHIHS